MPWEDLGGHLLALLIYPGGLSALLVGLAAEIGAAWALVPERGGLAAAARGTLRLVPRTAPPPAAWAWVLALAAATQLAAPFSPVPAAERNTLVAAAALLAAAWLAWSWGWGRRAASARLVLTVQAIWLLAVLLPSMGPGNLRPQALGAVVLGGQVPLKLACGLLYLACLPALLMLLPESAPQGPPGTVARAQSPEESGFLALRVLLWMPCCGLFTSLFFPSGDGFLAVVRFPLVTLGAAAVAIAVAANLTRRPAGVTRLLYERLALPFAGFAVLVAALTPVLVH
ncbi:MAG TPA: hypothetical protein VF160_06840 [Candidatus Dormibacteraeota bacterium]